MKTPVLKTKRLILRPLSIDDAPWIQKKFNDWNIVRYMNASVPWPYPDDGAETFLKTVVLPNIQENKAFHWAICLPNNLKEGVGVISFRHNIDVHDGHRGFWIETQKQRKGYITEAVGVVNDFVFNDLGFEEFRVENAIDNIGSHKVKIKTGAKLIGTHERDFVCGKCETEVWT
ncbi:MAG: GNAT family N-acetyltransferase, partial [Micavibrio sp.]|nr:GNAT family N-acetyltransferase [Micavibrio sp.]